MSVLDPRGRVALWHGRPSNLRVRFYFPGRAFHDWRQQFLVWKLKSCNPSATPLQETQWCKNVQDFKSKKLLTDNLFLKTWNAWKNWSIKGVHAWCHEKLCQGPSSAWNPSFQRQGNFPKDSWELWYRLQSYHPRIGSTSLFTLVLPNINDIKGVSKSLPLD